MYYGVDYLCLTTYLAYLCEILELFFFFNDTKSAVIALVIPITITKYF